MMQREARPDVKRDGVDATTAAWSDQIGNGVDVGQDGKESHACRAVGNQCAIERGGTPG
jgi:hypothetical protein